MLDVEVSYKNGEEILNIKYQVEKSEFIRNDVFYMHLTGIHSLPETRYQLAMLFHPRAKINTKLSILTIKLGDEMLYNKDWTEEDYKKEYKRMGYIK